MIRNQKIRNLKRKREDNKNRISGRDTDHGGHDTPVARMAAKARQILTAIAENTGETELENWLREVVLHLRV